MTAPSPHFRQALDTEGPGEPGPAPRAAPSTSRDTMPQRYVCLHCRCELCPFCVINEGGVGPWCGECPLPLNAELPLSPKSRARDRAGSAVSATGSSRPRNGSTASTGQPTTGGNTAQKMNEGATACYICRARYGLLTWKRQCDDCHRYTCDSCSRKLRGTFEITQRAGAAGSSATASSLKLCLACYKVRVNDIHASRSGAPESGRTSAAATPTLGASIASAGAPRANASVETSPELRLPPPRGHDTAAAMCPDSPSPQKPLPPSMAHADPHRMESLQRALDAEFASASSGPHRAAASTARDAHPHAHHEVQHQQQHHRQQQQQQLPAPHFVVAAVPVVHPPNAATTHHHHHHNNNDQPHMVTAVPLFAANPPLVPPPPFSVVAAASSWEERVSSRASQHRFSASHSDSTGATPSTSPAPVVPIGPSSHHYHNHLPQTNAWSVGPSGGYVGSHPTPNASFTDAPAGHRRTAAPVDQLQAYEGEDDEAFARRLAAMSE